MSKKTALPETHSYAQACREFYDEGVGRTLLYSDDARRISGQSLNAILEVYADQFDKENTTVLDFACGIGIISEGLAPYCKSITGVDITPSVANEYNKTAAAAGLSHKMKAICTNIEEHPEDLSNDKFDLAICVNAYNHFRSISSITRTIASFLKSSGSLIVISHPPEESESPSPPKSTLSSNPNSDEGKEKVKLSQLTGREQIRLVSVHPLGHTKEDMKAAFESAGLEMTVFKDAYVMILQGRVIANAYVTIGKKINTV